MSIDIIWIGDKFILLARVRFPSRLNRLGEQDRPQPLRSRLLSIGMVWSGADHSFDLIQESAGTNCVFQHAFPDPQHTPTSSTQSRRHSAVPSLVDTYLCDPEFSVAFWRSLTSCAAMPKAPIYKNYDPQLHEYKIRLTEQSWFVHRPPRERPRDQMRPQPLFGGPTMPRFDQRHNSRSCGWGYSIHLLLGFRWFRR
jgi:hypothetical protein